MSACTRRSPFWLPSWLLLFLRLLPLGGFLSTAEAATPFVVPGEPMGDGTVTSLLEHPEFNRVTLRLPDGAILDVEIMPTKAGHRPACEAGPLGAYPRWEELGLAVEVEEQPTAVLALCRRLREREGSLHFKETTADIPYITGSAINPDGQPRTGGEALRSLPIQFILIAVVLLIGLGGLLGIRVGLLALRSEPSARLDLGLVALLSLGARLLLSPRTIFIGPDAGYETLVMAWGNQNLHPTYGGGFVALMAPGQWLAPRSADAVFTTHLLLASLAAPLLSCLVRLLNPGPSSRLPALIAGLGMALYPVHIRLSATEVMPLSLPTLELGAMVSAAALLRGGNPGWALLAGLCTGLVPNIRPEAATFLPVGLGALLYSLWCRRLERAVWVAVLSAYSLCLFLFSLRFSALPQLDSGGPTSLSAMFSPATLLGLVLPSFSADPVFHQNQVFLCLVWTPLLLPLLAAASILSRRRGLWWSLSAWLVLVLLPVLPKDSPDADAWRLQLPAVVPALLLSALGVEVLMQRLKNRGRGLLLAAVILPPILWIPWIRHPWSPHAEWRLLKRSLSTLPEGATLLFADRGSHTEKVQAVMRELAPELTIEPMGPWLDQAAPPKDTFAWMGVLCHLQSLPGRDMALKPDPCARLSQQCRLTPWDVEEIEGGGDTDLFPDAPYFSIGLFRIDGCRPPASDLSNEQPER